MGGDSMKNYLLTLLLLLSLTTFVTAGQVLTNLLVVGTTSTPNPNVTGVYTQITDYNGYPRWYNTNTYYVWRTVEQFTIGQGGGSGYSGPVWRGDSTNPTGIYSPLGDGQSTGQITVTYSYTTNDYVKIYGVWVKKLYGVTVNKINGR